MTVSAKTLDPKEYGGAGSHTYRQAMKGFFLKANPSHGPIVTDPELDAYIAREAKSK